MSNATYHACPRVAADPARVHLRQLQAQGIGSRQLAADTGISRAVILAVLAGTKVRLHAATAARLLLARPVLAHGARVAGTKTWRYVDSLKREGFTKRELAFHLGAQSQQLQLARHVRVRSALKVSALYDRLAGDC